MKRILISYYTETQSTKEVCSKIKNLLDNTFDVDLMAIDAINSIEGYETIVLAAPIHGMRWHHKAMDFLIKHQTRLNSKELVYIALASMAYQGRPFWQKKVFKSLEKPSKIVPPLETAVFGGLTGEMPAFLSILFGIPKNVQSDQRDWAMIDAWTHNLIKKLKT